MNIVRNKLNTNPSINNNAQESANKYDNVSKIKFFILFINVSFNTLIF